MKNVNIRFETDETLEDIEIIVRSNSEDKQISELLQRLKTIEPIKMTVLDENNCPNVIDESEIVFISVRGKSVQIVTSNGTYNARHSLQSIEKLLSRCFLRVSRFEIINLKKVRKYDFTLGGTLRIEFINGMGTWASRRFIPLIKERLSEEEGYLC